MSARGADFSDPEPTNNVGALDLAFDPLSTSADLDTGTIQQVTPTNSFRLGQQIFFWLGLQNQIATLEGVPNSENWVNRVRIKLWWARPAREYRQPGGGGGHPGSDTFLRIDQQVYGSGPNNGLLDNRYVWVPSPKRLDVTEFDTAPPPLPPARNSDSLLLDDCWTADLYDPSDAALQAKFAAPQVVTRWASILYPAHGYALGFTAQVTTQFTPEAGVIATPSLFFNLTWAQGTFGGGASIQESIG